jgi:hypothetical protein
MSGALLTLALAACSRAPGAPQAAPDQPLDAVRVALPAPGPVRAPRSEGQKPAWSGNAQSATLAYPDERLLTVACEGGKLVVTRHAPADKGASALFALIGNGAILRLPVEAVAVPGVKWPEWRGSIFAGDEKVKVFLGQKLDATLPGAGKIEVPGGPELKAVVERCAPVPKHLGDSGVPAQAGTSIGEARGP